MFLSIRTGIVCLTLVLTVVISSPLRAQQIDRLLDLSLEELMDVTVVTPSRYEEGINDSPGNIQVFTRKQIRQRGYRNIEDLLRGLPGVHVQRYSILGPYNTISFRGTLGNNRFLILQDGVRLSSPGGELTAIAHNYPLYYAKRVEVLMGPASVVYGADAFAGVVNIITMDDHDESLGEISVDLGEDDYGSASVLLHNSLKENAWLNIGAHGFRSRQYDFAADFPELYDDPSMDYPFDNTRAGHFLINYNTGRHWQFGLNLASQSNPGYFSAKPSFSEFDVNAKEIVRQTTAYARFEDQITDDFESSTLLTLMEYELDNDSYFNNAFTNGDPGYKYANTRRISLNQDFEYRSSDTHLVSGGLVYDYFDTIPRGPDLSSPYNTSRDPDHQNLDYINTSLPIEFFDRDYYNAGIYFQDNWRIDNSWRLVTGVRYDDNSLYGSSSNPRISLIYRSDNRHVSKLLYGKAFMAPAPDQAFTSFGEFTGNQNASGEWLSSASLPFRVPNPALQPEDIETLEFSHQYWIAGNTSIKFSVYYSRIDGVILLREDPSPDQAIPGAQLLLTSKHDNVGSSEIHGIDISFDQKISAGNWRFMNWMTLGYVDGYLDDEGVEMPLAMTSHYKVTAGTTISYGHGWTFTPQFYWADTTYTNQIDPSDDSELLTVPAYSVIDLLVNRRLGNNISAKLAVYNLLDDKYSNAVYPPAFISLDRAPQPGRLISIGAEFRFR